MTYGATDGFQIIEDGVVTDGSDDDVRDSFGSDTGPGYFFNRFCQKNLACGRSRLSEELARKVESYADY